jgi:hypothetical protein
LLALALTVSCANAARRKHGRQNDKKNDWDALDTLLKRIDKGGAAQAEETSVPEETPTRTSQENASGENGKKEPKKNPCENHQCGWGKECVVVDGTKTKCDCIRKCPTSNGGDPFEKACSNTNETYDNMCELYKERCLCRREDAACRDPKNKHMHIEYMGMCKNLEPCTGELMDQFPVRMADWLFQVMRDLKKRQELHGDKWQRMITRPRPMNI